MSNTYQNTNHETFWSSLFFFLLFLSAQSQSFTNTGGRIPDDGATATCFPVTVSGIGNINGSNGLASVCLNILHTWDADLEIKLKAPDGTIVVLSLKNGVDGDNYTNTCFTSNAATPITNAAAPFTGDYLAQGNLGTFNNGQNANGTWYLCVKDVSASDSGSVVNFTLNFNNAPAAPLPVCSANQQTGNTCSLATLICNYSVYCGNTSSAYTTNTWPELTAIACSSIENNSFLKFVAGAETGSFSITANSSVEDRGIQVMVYHGGCGAGAVVRDFCNSAIEPGLPTVVTATGLIPGNTYYIMIDGNSGDACNYVLSPVSGIDISAVPPPPIVTGPVLFCQGGTPVALSNAVGGQNLLWYTSATGGIGSAIAPMPNTAIAGTTTFYVSQSTICGESTRQAVIVNIVTATAAITSYDTAICFGTAATIDFTGTPYSIFTYTVNENVLRTGTFGADGVLSISTGNLFASTEYKLVNAQLINFPGCTQFVYDSVLITVMPVPTASISYDTSIACGVSTDTLHVTLSGMAGGTFTGTPNSLHINPSTGEITPALSTPGIYTVTYTTEAGPCRAISNATVNIVSPAQHVWTGAANTAWENAGNWSCGNIPGISSDVILTQGNIVISSNVTINSLSIDPNVVLTIAPGYHLTIVH